MKPNRDMEEDVTLLCVPRSVNKRPWKIISGGQTGVDRAGLVAAMSYCIPFGGWVPKGRLAEDGVVPENFYALWECDGGYRERTRANVDSSDATLILVDRLPLSGGTAYTAEYAAKQGKPCKTVDLNAEDAEVQIREWMLSLESTTVPAEKKQVVLNVAGPRESGSPGIFEKAKKVLLHVFAVFRNGSGGDICDIDANGTLYGWISSDLIKS